MKEKTIYTPEQIFEEFRKGNSYKDSIGDNGIRKQAKINERFYVGDQWHGANCSNERPLVRRNIIKRIGDYKNAIITAADIAVNYSAEGVPDTSDMKDEEKAFRDGMTDSDYSAPSTLENVEISVITSAISDYFRTTAERLRFDHFKEQIVHNAYISGTGILYTYWDDTVETGLYADESKKSKIKGDIAIELLDVENVVFGDPNCAEIQSQPYIDVAQRRTVEDVKREAVRNGKSVAEIKPDSNEAAANSGARGTEPEDSKRCTVITRFYKDWDETGEKYTIKAIRVTEKAVIRDTWDLEIKLYPFAVFQWEPRRSSIYGDSEITYLIPNQIAINRALTAAVWGMMSSGMPIMLVNGDVVTGEVSNAPGQIIKVFGSSEDVIGAIRYLNPPVFAGQYQNMVNDLAGNTLGDAGATDSALGNVRPDNAAAIIQMREAATQPMTIYINRFYDFVEQVARIWCNFWFNLYGKRSLKITDKDGTRYIPFDPDRYKELVITTRINVGASALWSVPIVQNTLDALLAAGIITPEQYFSRVPQGIIPDVGGLLDDLKVQQGQVDDQNDVLADLQSRYPKEYARLMQLPPEQRQAYIQNAMQGGMMNNANDSETDVQQGDNPTGIY